MKIRNDFVSNSSSCSFIISVPKNINKEKFANDLLNGLMNITFDPKYDFKEYRDSVIKSLEMFRSLNRERIIDGFSTKINPDKDTDCELFDSKICGFYDKGSLIAELERAKRRVDELQNRQKDPKYKELYKKEYLYYIEDEKEKEEYYYKSIRSEIKYYKYEINAIENAIKILDDSLVMAFPINYEGNGQDGDGLNLRKFNSAAFKKYQILYYFQG